MKNLKPRGLDKTVGDIHTIELSKSELKEIRRFIKALFKELKKVTSKTDRGFLIDIELEYTFTMWIPPNCRELYIMCWNKPACTVKFETKFFGTDLLVSRRPTYKMFETPDWAPIAITLLSRQQEIVNAFKTTMVDAYKNTFN